MNVQPDVLTICVRLGLAVVLGGLIGEERESRQRPAGFRTHVLVCIGSAVVMLISEFLFYNMLDGTGARNDTARLGAQVISGIGFLGAGTIIRTGETVKGLTTAASLWATACVGLAVGSGAYEVAVISTLFIVIVLLVFQRVERFMQKRKQLISLRIEMTNDPHILAKISETTQCYGGVVKTMNMDFDSESTADEATSFLTVLIKVGSKKTATEEVVLALKSIEGIKSVGKL